MALNFTVSYTFSPSTTIASSQVNTNTSDVANVFTGLEAETKTLAKLKMDADPTIALEVATKQYVDHYSTWRRPVLQFGSITTIAVEAGLDGTSGDIPMLFPDGTVRTETSTTRTTFNITRNAVLVTSGAQSGLTGATSEATNTWYALYACKVTDSSTQWVTVGSTVLPIQANFSTLNTAYGANGWVYLGMVRNGDQGSTSGDLLDFVQQGNFTKFSNTGTGGNVQQSNGVLLATSGSTTALAYATSKGTAGAVIPNHVNQVYVLGCAASVTNISVQQQTGCVLNQVATITSAGAGVCLNAIANSRTSEAIRVVPSGAAVCDLWCLGFWDGVLGVGSNPLL